MVGDNQEVIYCEDVKTMENIESITIFVINYV